MLYAESSPTAAEFAQRAVEKMAELNIAANPMNFTIWYNYFSDSVSGLKQSLDTAISSGAEFDVPRNEQIFAEYFSGGEDSQQIAQTSLEIEAKIDQAMSYVGEASADNEGFGEKLAGYSDALANGSSKEEMASVVRAVLLETQNVIAKSKQLEKKLQDSSEEISGLRNNLQEVRIEALTDGLTGIANRKCFDQRLREEAERSQGEGTTLCLLLADIDHFKAFNDTYGHRIGDSVLKVVARNLKDAVKGADLPARYGGEEFAIIFPETELENAVIVANQIREKLAKKELKNSKSGESYGCVTLSIGVARYRTGEPLSDLIQRADEGLYQGKETGRNRVVSETELREPNLKAAAG